MEPPILNFIAAVLVGNIAGSAAAALAEQGIESSSKGAAASHVARLGAFWLAAGLTYIALIDEKRL